MLVRCAGRADLRKFSVVRVASSKGDCDVNRGRTLGLLVGAPLLVGLAAMSWSLAVAAAMATATVAFATAVTRRIWNGVRVPIPGFRGVVALLAVTTAATVPTLLLSVDLLLHRREGGNAVLVALVLGLVVGAWITPVAAALGARYAQQMIVSAKDAANALVLGICGLLGLSVALVVLVVLYDAYRVAPYDETQLSLLWALLSCTLGVTLTVVASCLLAMVWAAGVQHRQRMLRRALGATLTFVAGVSVAVGIDLYVQDVTFVTGRGGANVGYKVDVRPVGGTASELDVTTHVVTFVLLDATPVDIPLDHRRIRATAGPGFIARGVVIPGPGMYEGRVVSSPGGKRTKLKLCLLDSCPVELRIEGLPRGAVWEIREATDVTREPFGDQETIDATVATQTTQAALAFSYLPPPWNLPILSPIMQQLAPLSTFAQVATFTAAGLTLLYGPRALRRGFGYVAATTRRRWTGVGGDLEDPQASSGSHASTSADSTHWSVPAGHSLDPFEALRQLHRLREEGIISTADFDGKKAELLSRI
jgi:hypothetical protein